MPATKTRKKTKPKVAAYKLDKDGRETVHEKCQEAFDFACKVTRRFGVKEWNAYDGSNTGYNVWEAMLLFVDPKADTEGLSGVDDDCRQTVACQSILDLALQHAFECLILPVGADDSDPKWSKAMLSEAAVFFKALKKKLDSEYNS